MTRELDAEIAELLGCTITVYGPRGFEYLKCGCPDAGGPKPPHGDPRSGVLNYSSDLNALMALIRDRWPGAIVTLSAVHAFVERDWTQHKIGDGPWSADGDTDVERLAHAVAAALREGSS